MSRTILKQANGKYCVYSSIVENIIIYDATPEEIFNQYLVDEKILLKIKLEEWLKEADEMSLDEKISVINTIRLNKETDDLGDQLFEEAKKLLGINKGKNVKYFLEV